MFRRLTAQAQQLPLQFDDFLDPVDMFYQAIVVDGFFQIIVGARSHRIDRVANFSSRRNHQEHHVRKTAARPFQDFDSIAVRKINIEQRNFRFFRENHLFRLTSGSCFHDLIAGFSKSPGQGPAKEFFIINDQQFQETPPWGESLQTWFQHPVLR